MKKTTYFLLALLIGTGNALFAQNEHSGHQPKSSQPTAAGQSTHDEYMVMQNGKMMMMHKGMLMPMAKDMTMSDGTICMTDGTCKRKDGTTVKMKEGDHCMIDNGKMVIHAAAEKPRKKTKTGMKGMPDE